MRWRSGAADGRDPGAGERPPVGPADVRPEERPADVRPEERPAEERRRPVGGAAAWRRVPDAPVRPSYEQRRERDRYARASLREQLGGTISAFLGNRWAVTISALLVGGFVLLRILTPAVASFAELRPGDCLYVRAGDPESAIRIGTPQAVRTRLVAFGAERASCDLAHGHEVLALVDPPLDPQSDRWPGLAALLAHAEPACAEAFEAVGARAALDPGLAITAVPPDQFRWAAGIRQSVCLVHRADGTFLSGRALPPP